MLSSLADGCDWSLASQLNNELLTQSTWDEEAIRSRSRRVAEHVSARWPDPTSEEWSEIK